MNHDDFETVHLQNKSFPTVAPRSGVGGHWTGQREADVDASHPYIKA